MARTQARSILGPLKEGARVTAFCELLILDTRKLSDSGDVIMIPESSEYGPLQTYVKSMAVGSLFAGFGPLS